MNRSFSGVLSSFVSLVCVALAGCAGLQQTEVHTTVVKANTKFIGTVHGGQQPVVGAAIQIYALGNGIDGGAGIPLLTTPVLTDASGSFSIDPNSYTCPEYGSQTYITATGGNPGLAASNPNIAAMAMTEACGALPVRYISINEVTTAASVFFFGQYFGQYPNISLASTNFAAGYVYTLKYESILDLGTGLFPGATYTSNESFPVSKLYTLANVIASCINSSGGTAGDTTPCGKLFTLTTPPGGTAPTNTVDALVNVYRYPNQNVQAIYALSTANPPFQPALSSPPADWYLRYTTGTPATPKYNLCSTWGDSLTQGNEDGSNITIAIQLANLPSCYAGNNQGVGGQTSTQIGIRQGGVHTTVTVDNGLIPASGSVGVTFPTNYQPIGYTGPAVVPGTISGVDGLVYLDFSTYTPRFQRNNPGAAVVSPANTPFTVPVGNYNSGFTVIWAGRNNSGDKTQILSDIAAMVASLPSPKHYVVLSLTNRNSDYEFKGADGYKEIKMINQALAAAYPSNYLDIRSAVIAAYDPSNAEDVIDYNHDVPPSTLRAVDIAGTLATAIDASTCTIQVNYSAPIDYVLMVEGEKIRVTNETDEQHITSCIRGYAGTTAVAHAANTTYKGEDYIHLSGTADLIIARLVDQFIQSN